MQLGSFLEVLKKTQSGNDSASYCCVFRKGAVCDNREILEKKRKHLSHTLHFAFIKHLLSVKALLKK